MLLFLKSPGHTTVRFNKILFPAALLVGLCCDGPTVARAEKPAAVAARLGFDGCKLSKPLTIAEVMAKDMSGGNGASRAHPDWDELIARRQSGDQVYFVDCRRVDLSNILAGTSLYILVRAGAVIARVAETGIN